MFKEALIGVLLGHIPLLALIAGFASTEILIILSALAGAGNVPVITVFLFGLAGEILHDVVFFYLAKTSFVNSLRKKFKLSKGRNRVAELIEKTAYKGYFVPLLLAKFVYGVRDAVVLYVGHKEKNIKKYFLVCTSASIVSLTILVGLGWLAGRGVIALTGLYGDFEKIIGLILVAAIIVYLIYRIIGKIVIKAYDNSLKKINHHVKNLDKGIKKIDKKIMNITDKVKEQFN